MGFNRDGGYGQYELVHENIFFPVPEEFSATEATLLLDIMGTGGHAVERCQMMRPDIESLLIVGAGPIGLGVLAMAKIILGGQLKVLIADVIPIGSSWQKIWAASLLTSPKLRSVQEFKQAI